MGFGYFEVHLPISGEVVNRREQETDKELIG